MAQFCVKSCKDVRTAFIVDIHFYSGFLIGCTVGNSDKNIGFSHEFAAGNGNYKLMSLHILGNVTDFHIVAANGIAGERGITVVTIEVVIHVDIFCIA